MYKATYKGLNVNIVFYLGHADLQAETLYSKKVGPLVMKYVRTFGALPPADKSVYFTYFKEDEGYIRWVFSGSNVNEDDGLTVWMVPDNYVKKS